MNSTRGAFLFCLRLLGQFPYARHTFLLEQVNDNRYNKDKDFRKGNDSKGEFNFMKCFVRFPEVKKFMIKKNWAQEIIFSS
ncbi:hypothetical protein D1835_13530 [Enterococcus asini]|nr:hypothetical protein [Enterococcus asini]